MLEEQGLLLPVTLQKWMSRCTTTTDDTTSQTQAQALLDHHHQHEASASLIKKEKDEYLTRAVDLSLMLTTRLGQLVEAGEITVSDIVIENVLVLVHDGNARSSLQQPTTLASQLVFNRGGKKSLVAKGVQFQLDAPLVILSNSNNNSIGADCGSSSSRAMCAALGSILLEIFSRGRSPSSGTSNVSDTSSMMSHNNPSNICNHGDSAMDIDDMSRSHKRRGRTMETSSSPNTNNNNPLSASAMANSILLEIGTPLSICRLVSDLLDSIDQPPIITAITKLQEVLWDLTQMKKHPHTCLFDKIDPRKALDDTCLFGGGSESLSEDNRQLFGREKELNILNNVKKTIAHHVGENSTKGGKLMQLTETFDQGTDFKCEAVFLSGYSGSGKSALLHSLTKSCADDDGGDGWFVLCCKDEKEAAPIDVLAKAFDDFFGKWSSTKDEDKDKGNSDNMMESFDQICRCILSTIDQEGLSTLSEMIPNLRKISPGPSQSATLASLLHINISRDQGTSSMYKIGSVTKRRMNLFNVLFKSICSSGKPVILALDDIQSASSLEGIKDFVVNYINIPFNILNGARHQGLMIVGAFRSNEAKKQDKNESSSKHIQGIIETIKSINHQSEGTNVTMLPVGELSQGDMVLFLSATLHLPFRYTMQLASLVLVKTRGNPFFIIQFLRSIIQNGMLKFSLDSRRWKWDCDVIDMQMISDGVAELLTTRFNQLPGNLMSTLKILSCISSQVDASIIDVINSEQKIPFNMQNVLQLAINEGMIERAGPIYQFTHDQVRETIYEAIPKGNRKLMHKVIGESLLNEPQQCRTIFLLAVDQINKYCEGDTTLSADECSKFATINASAARFSIATSSFEQARSYIDAGMKLLEEQRWESQYNLTLELYEMSASVSCINGGDVGTMSKCLAEILSNVKSFEDSLNASSLLAKLLASASKYGEAMENCLSILSSLGEELPQDTSLPVVLNELSVIQTTLADITFEQVKLLPPMTDKSKLHAMKFLSMLSSYSVISMPMLVPILSCRMVRLTIEHGFCDDSIVGLVTAGYGMFSFTDQIELGYRIGKVGEKLIEESRNRHALRSRLCIELEGTLKCLVEPVQSAVSLFPDLYNSAMLAGNVETAVMCRRLYCNGIYFTGQSDLLSCSNHLVMCVQLSAKFQQRINLFSTMSTLRACTNLTGESNFGVDIMSFEALDEIGTNTNNALLQWQVFLDQMSTYFYTRDFIQVVELSQQRPHTHHKRITEVVRIFFEGIASLSLARQTHQNTWRVMGEKAVEEMKRWSSTASKWNFENQAHLLQAELHYLNGNLMAAETSFNASITTACERKFIHEEAVAHECYGMFCLENSMVNKGVGQLQMGLKKYEEWGAAKKADALKDFIDGINHGELAKLNLLSL